MNMIKLGKSTCSVNKKVLVVAVAKKRNDRLTPTSYHFFYHLHRLQIKLS